MLICESGLIIVVLVVLITIDLVRALDKIVRDNMIDFFKFLTSTDTQLKAVATY